MFARLYTSALTSFSFLALVTSAWGAEIAAESRISAVTVYGDRATVTRSAQISVAPGDHVATITGLPAGLIPDSLRAQGESTADVVLGAVENKISSSAELAAPRERALEAKLEELQDQRALIVAEQESLKSRQAFLDKIGTAAATRVNEDIGNTLTLKPDEWLDAAEKIFTATRDTAKTTQAHVVALRKLDDEVAAVQSELEEIETGAKQTYTVRVPFTARNEGVLTLDIQYQTYGAWWRPLYDARLSTETKSLTLTQFGEVRQTTGEDWTDAKLTLSTAQPARSATPPDLFTQWLSLFDPSAAGLGGVRREMIALDKMEISAEMDGAPAAPAEFKKAAEAPPAPAAFQGAQIETGGYVAQYKIPGTASVASDNSAKKLMIQTLKVDTALLNQVRPALDTNVYLIARTKLGEGAPLLPGSVNLFRDNVFIGAIYQPLLRPGEEMDLAFGVDDQVTVKRQILVDERGESGLVSAQSTLARAFETEIQNLHSFESRVEILESTPVPQDERIKVTLEADKITPGYENDVKKITGLKRWVLNLAPQATQSVKLGWTITWPKSMQVNGI